MSSQIIKKALFFSTPLLIDIITDNENHNKRFFLFLILDLQVLFFCNLFIFSFFNPLFFFLFR